MPEEGVAWLPKEQILSFEEIADVVRAAIEVHGIRRFKLTGGEPTVRHGLLDLVAMLRRIPGIEDLSLTTNGQRLLELAGPLKEAGLDRVTVSLDSLKADRFKQITRTGDLHAVLAGIDRCVDVGFGSLKINCVTMRGTNDDELADFAEMTIERPITVRFIEYMPLGDAAVQHRNDEVGTMNDERQAPGVHRSSFIVHTSEQGPAGGCGAQDRGDVFVSEAEIRAAIEAVHGPLVPVERDSEAGVGPAKVFRVDRPGVRGRVGFISAMSAPFCDTCNRLRLTADGLLRSCLFEGGEVDVRPILRGGTGHRYHRLAEAMTECVRLKPDVHSGHGNKQMSRIGG
jgi:cyclic pyranopterin phosphate synthase